MHDTGLEIDLSDLLEGMDTNAEQILSAAGRSPRAPTVFTIEGIAPLSPEIIEASRRANVGVSNAPPLKKLRDRHHRIAQLLAKGMRPGEIASITGYSISRISTLQADESFAELVSHYKELSTAIFVDTVEKMKALTDDAIEVMQERLEENPDSFTNPMLIETVKIIGDRAGFSPVQKSVNVNIPIENDRLAAIKARVADRSTSQVRRITQEAVNADYETIKETQGTQVGKALRSPSKVLQAPETQGLPSEGDNV